MCTCRWILMIEIPISQASKGKGIGSRNQEILETVSDVVK